ncbi:MAG: 50S ribosomal protein L9 [Chitinophagales bacterium]|nr:50S ribosomal protein L9 [Chitinophagales bacterium]MDW8427988.1 50S ribosomal protein L9 [Chitinophagales bacterium]
MEVILLQDVEKLGKENDIVQVRPGFARNYLIPRKLAVVADETQRKLLAERQRQEKRREEKLLRELARVVETLKSTRFTIGAKTGTSGRIFGKITTIQLAQAIKKQAGVVIDRKKITIPDDILMLGEYKAQVALHKDVEVEVVFEVVAE